MPNSMCQVAPSVSRARNPSSGVLRKLGVCNHDAVEGFHAPTSKEVHHVGSLFGPAGIYEVVLAASLHEHPVSLPHVYEAHRERAGGRRSTTEGSLAGYEAAGAGEED